MSTGHRGVAFSWSFLPRPPGRVARDPRVRVERGGRAVDLREHPRHLRRAQPAGPRRVRMVQETDDKEARAEERSDRADDDGLRNPALARVGEEEGVEEHERSGDEQEHPERSRDGAPARAHAVETRLLASGRLIEPLLVCRLFRGRRRLSGLKGPKEWDAPRVEPRLAACDEARPLEGDHRTAVADELAPEAPRDGSREELSRLELLDRERGLRLGAR